MVYTVGFDISSDPTVVSTLQNCATDPSKAHLANDSAGLDEDLQDIANGMLTCGWRNRAPLVQSTPDLASTHA